MDDRLETRVIEVLPSYYFQTAIVIKTECGHVHCRPQSMDIKVGETFRCPFDHDEKGDGLL